MKIRADETSIAGRWIIVGGSVIADQSSRRIDDLIDHYLVEVDRSDDGWSVLYKDPDDGRFWELTYPESTSHGGGPAHLVVVSANIAKARYKA